MNPFMQIFEAIRKDADDWCRHRLGYPRIVFPLWFILILIYLWKDPVQRGVLDWPNLFSGLNFGIHEFGHVLFHPLGKFMGILGGSLFQCMVPVIGMFMMKKQRDYFGITVCGAWLCSNMFYIAGYMKDAKVQKLYLLSPFTKHPIHDWNYLFNKLGLLNSCEGIALLVKILATIIMLLSIGAGCWLIWKMIEERPIETPDWAK